MPWRVRSRVGGERPRGLSSSAASMSFGEQELDDLGSVIDGLSFDDLEGLTTP